MDLATLEQLPILNRFRGCLAFRKKIRRRCLFGCLFALWIGSQAVVAQERSSISGIDLKLAMFNDEGECGTGAVVPWADRLWVVTYAPHAPKGSSDKLYEITPERLQIVRPESIGGTPANRMIHRESQQLLIGPYAIDAERTVRVIPYSTMFGRPTGTARHLTDPAGKVYYATMEEGIYEVDVKTLEVKELWADEQRKEGRHAGLPGYHGKGFFTAQGHIVYANNGEHGDQALSDPTVASGVLAEWDGQAEQWTIVRRNQFTEVTGPGGITGESQPDDPLWSIGWDHRSLILMCRDNGRWHSYRLPKASHSYDGAHGWNTEWPRIRDIGEDSLLMTMHGTFWKFPKTFRSTNSAGIVPRSTYLKVVGDFCRWQNQIVLGCDDTAKSEFLNKRLVKGDIAPPQSQSNLWFIDPERLDQLGPVIGRGAVWLNDAVPASIPSEPFLFSGYERRSLQLVHDTPAEATITLELDMQGTGEWTTYRTVTLEPRTPAWLDLTSAPVATWIRLISNVPLTNATAWFSMGNADQRSLEGEAIKGGLAGREEWASMTGGIVRARAENKRTLHFASLRPGPSGQQDVGLYELGDTLTLKPVNDPDAHKYLKDRAKVVTGWVRDDGVSIIYVDGKNRRWRLPRGMKDLRSSVPQRICREVATERDLFHLGGTFFELPAENAGGVLKMRAITTHNRLITDFCSYRGLLVLTGVADQRPADNPHLVASEDGKAALWVGALDDLWQFGKPHGTGGPWRNTSVRKNEPSDPYLLCGYDRKRMTLQQRSAVAMAIRIEYDLTGTGQWVPYETFYVPPNAPVTHKFPAALNGYWLRAVADRNAVATVQLTYD